MVTRKQQVLIIVMVILAMLLISSTSCCNTTKHVGVIVEELGVKVELKGSFYSYVVKEQGCPELQLVSRPVDIHNVGDSLIYMR